MKDTKQTVAHANHVLSGMSWKAKLSGVLLGGILAGGLFYGSSQALAVVPSAGTASLAWDSSPSSGVAGYRVYIGTSSGSYTSTVEAGNAMTSTISGLTTGARYYFAVKAYNASGMESPFSNEISFVPGTATLQLSVSANGHAVLTIHGLTGHTYNIEGTQDLRTWSALGNVTIGASGSASYTDTTAPSVLKRFYRTRDLQP